MSENLFDKTAISGGPQAPDPDSELVLMAKSQLPYQTAAYASLMERHQNLLLRICIKMLDSRHDAEDMCQDIMLKIFHALPTFEGRSSFKTWISRIATNMCINGYDKAKRRNQFKSMLAVDPTVIKETNLSSTKRDIDKAMQQLDLKDRQLLTLRYTADLKIEEISDIYGLGLSATKMRLYRAQESLKDLMAESA